MKTCISIIILLFFVPFGVKSQCGISNFYIGMSRGVFLDFTLNEYGSINKIKKINAYLVEEKFIDETFFSENILYELTPSKNKSENYLKKDIKFYEIELFNDTIKKYYIKNFNKNEIQLKNLIFIFYKDSLKYIKCQENGVGLNFSKEIFSETIPNNTIDSIFKKSNAIKYDFYTFSKNLFKRDKDSTVLSINFDTCKYKNHYSIIKNTDQSDFWINKEENIIISIRKYLYSNNCQINYLNRIECYDVNFFKYYLNNIRGVDKNFYEEKENAIIKNPFFNN